MKSSSSVRLLPVVMLATLVLIALKLASHVFTESSSVGSAVAQEAESTTEANDTQPAEEETIDPEATGQMVDAPTQAPEMEPQSEHVFSAAEKEVLESLLARRKKLEERDRALQLREKLLEAAEKRVEQRIAELKTIEQRIEETFGKQEEESKAQLKNLVSMYQNMKPKDAARIFDRLDMNIMIGVVQQMSARKMAPILAKMDSAVAQRLTVELAKRAEARARQ